MKMVGGPITHRNLQRQTDDHQRRDGSSRSAESTTHDMTVPGLTRAPPSRAPITSAAKVVTETGDNKGGETWSLVSTTQSRCQVIESTDS